jgi:hypothetical protein
MSGSAASGIAPQSASISKHGKGDMESFTREAGSADLGVEAGEGAFLSAQSLSFTGLVGQTVVAANELVSAWAVLYAAISGHNLGFVGRLFDKWAREGVQRDHLSQLARDFLAKLPRELEGVETLLARATELSHERDLLISQPWSITQFHEMRQAEPLDEAGHFPVREEFLLEHIAQFQLLLEGLDRLHADVMALAAEFGQSRDVEKARVLNRSAVLAAELKLTRKPVRKSGSRHKDWPQPLRA